MHIEFAYFYFTLFIGIEMITTFIHSRSSLENHTQFQTKMGKVYTRFQTKTAKKTLPDGEAHTHIAYITAKGYFKNVEEQVIRRHSKVWSDL